MYRSTTVSLTRALSAPFLHDEPRNSRSIQPCSLFFSSRPFPFHPAFDDHLPSKPHDTFNPVGFNDIIAQSNSPPPSAAQVYVAVQRGKSLVYNLALRLRPRVLDMVDRMAEELSASVGVAGNIDVRVVAVAVAVGFEVADMMVVDAGR